MGRSNDKRELIKYESTDITLADEQHDDMCTLMNQIDDVGNEDLKRIFTEGDSYGVGDKIRAIWKTDWNCQLRDSNVEVSHVLRMSCKLVRGNIQAFPQRHSMHFKSKLPSRKSWLHP